MQGKEGQGKKTLLGGRSASWIDNHLDPRGERDRKLEIASRVGGRDERKRIGPSHRMGKNSIRLVEGEEME